MATKKGLGAKGLGIEALIHNKMEDFESDGGGVLELDLHKIEPNRKQPRKHFDETALEELATSLKNYGMIQPVVVKKNKEGYYELIAAYYLGNNWEKRVEHIGTKKTYNPEGVIII